MSAYENWYCERCGKAGSVTIGDDTGVWGVFQLIARDHLKHSKMKCRDSSLVRVGMKPRRPVRVRDEVEGRHDT